ncbi:unnamed protein product [Amoebophrya sp. A120]|nr:unnamed protein product [Amoebophrya sp. A120]|eukprot:GSA120T00010648001.1
MIGANSVVHPPGPASGAGANQEQEKQVRDTFAKMEDAVAKNSCLMFSTKSCPYCHYAKDFLQHFGKKCHTIQLDEENNRLLGAVVTAVTNQRTVLEFRGKGTDALVPNIFIEQLHVGGYDELLAVEQQCRNTQSLLATDKKYEKVCSFFSENSPPGAQGQAQSRVGGG